MEMVSGSRPANDEGSMRLSMARSYGTFTTGVERRRRMFMHILVLGMVLMTAGTISAQTPAATPAAGQTKPIKMVVLGDSLSAGLGLSPSAAFPEGVAADARLNQADGMHPTGEGVDVIVKNILPTVEAFLGAISGQRS